LILDEPTAVLTPQETERLFDVLRNLCASGCSVILITHRIPEVMGIADRVTVLRDARKIITAPIDELDESELARHMIGRPLSPAVRGQAARSTIGGLTLEGVSLKKRGLEKLRDVTLAVRSGEVFGIAGVDGNGQKELAEVVMGIQRQDAGAIALSGQPLDKLDVEARRRSGIAYIPDDRHRDALVMDMGLTENLLLRFSADKRFRKRGLLNAKAARAKTERCAKDYAIKAHALDTPIRTLSGGNQQKMILARELMDEPRLIVACQPTRGLDVGAAEFVQKQLLSSRDRGAAVLLISADLDEICALSDRFAVLHGGSVMGVVENDGPLDMAEIGLMMAGRRRNVNGGCAN
jgi:simple sugar transport system ATP-binding protein